MRCVGGLTLLIAVASHAAALKVRVMQESSEALAFAGAAPGDVMVPSGHWPLTLKGDQKTWHPQPQWQLASEDSHWNQEQREWRKPQYDGSVVWGEGVGQAFEDNIVAGNVTTDTYYWTHHNNSDDPHDAYWKELCQGAMTNETKQESPFKGWKVKNDTSCDPKMMIDGEITDEMEAYKKCGQDCSSIVDMSCNRTKFKLCKMGAVMVEASGTCLLPRFPEHRAPDNKPTKPVEKEFWKSFCAKSSAKFRVLFRGKLCEAGKTLDKVYAEGGCADAAVKDTECSDVFDFQEGAPPVCRCVEKGKVCKAVNVKPEESTGLFQGVFAILT